MKPVRYRTPQPRGITSRGERIVETNAEARAAARAARMLEVQMPTRGARSRDEVRGSDVPLVLAAPGPRDALTDPRPEDYVPEIDTKGYHTGLVRQPAEPVLTTARSIEDDGTVRPAGSLHFESLPEAGESKFEHGSLRELKDAHNADPVTTGEGTGVDLGGGRNTVVDELGVAAVNRRRAAAAARSTEGASPDAT